MWSGKKTVTSLDNVCYSIRKSFFKLHSPPHPSQWRAPASGKEFNGMFPVVSSLLGRETKWRPHYVKPSLKGHLQWHIIIVSSAFWIWPLEQAKLDGGRQQWRPVLMAVTEKDLLLYDCMPWTRDAWASPCHNYPLVATR